MQQTIYLAGGCFWGVQGYFDLLRGVIETRVGYANSLMPNPSYEMVCSDTTNAVEAIEIIYDSKQMPLYANEAKKDIPECLLSRFFSIIDPCTLNYQGNDRGTQYRSGIYIPKNQTSHKIIMEINNFISQYIAPNYKQEIVTEVMLLQNFYAAEAYHQKYLAKNPNGYCHIDIKKALLPLN